MNQNGWGLRDMLVFLGVICIAILITMFLYNRTFKELFDTTGGITDIENETYADMETELERTAHAYTDNYYGKILEDGDEDNITLRQMQEENLITVVKDIEDDKIICSGYVHFKTANGKTRYDSYIKCGDNYQTPGYREKYDEAVKKQ